MNRTELPAKPRCRTAPPGWLLPASWPGAAVAAPAGAYSGQQLTLIVLTLIVCGLAIALLIVLWSARRQRSLARDIERSEAEFNAFFDASPAGMAILDRDLRFVRINETLARINGRAVADHVGQPIERAAPDLPASVLPLMREVLVTGRGLHNVELPARAPAQPGRDSHWLVSFFPIYTHSARIPIGAGAVVQDITQLKHAEQALERSRADLRRLGAHREGLIEREHQRLAREFHDELGQVLTTARMHLQLLERGLPAEAAASRDAARHIETMIAEAYRSVKTIASDLRPAALNLGLAAAVEWVAARMLEPARVGYDIVCAPAADRLDDDYAIALFRIVQESLTNIVRHANARNVHITLGDEDGAMQLLIEDDGGGFDVGRVDHAAHFGLLGISERVTSLGGRLEIDSAPGAGTRIGVTLPQVPLKADAAERSSSPS
jgi:PAS domain S-box-containing protein